MRLSGHDIVCLSAIDWDHPVPAQAHALMGQLAEMNRVLWVDAPATPWRALRHVGEPRYQEKWAAWAGLRRGPRRLAQNLYVWTPPPGTPFMRLDAWRLRRALAEVLTELRFDAPIYWADAQRPGVPEVLAGVDACLVVSQLYGTDRVVSPPSRRALAMADLALVSTVSQRRELADAVPNAQCLPRGIEFDRFNRAVYSDTPLAADLAAHGRPIVAYVGEVGEAFDFKLWEWLAQKRPTWLFVAIGALRPGYQERAQRAMRQPNVQFLGPRPAEAIPSYLKAVSAVAFPLKRLDPAPEAAEVYECFAAGKPVVTTDLTLAEDLAARVSGKHEFLKALDDHVTQPSARGVFERIQRAQGHSWEARARRLEAILLDQLALKVKPSAIPLLVERIVRQRV
ncbi:MAG TPA: glycosyltransferase [Stenomitos sp.]